MLFNDDRYFYISALEIIGESSFRLKGIRTGFFLISLVWKKIFFLHEEEDIYNKPFSIRGKSIVGKRIKLIKLET